MGKVEDATATMIANMPEKTGKSLDQWLVIVKKTKLQKHGDIVKLLKADHAIGHGFANLIAHKALSSDAGSAEDEDLVSAQYSGAKAALKPIHDKLIKLVESFGKDIELSPKKAYVSLRRSKQFGLIQPSTATRLDLGLNLKGIAPTARLEPAGSWNAMVTHRVKLASAAEVDAELKAWLKAAYDAA